MTFSGALTLTDLNDFITPSQACIKPVEETNKPEEKEAGAAETEIQIDSAGGYYEVSANGQGSTPDGPPGKGKKLVQAEVSLSDCLACSGCITSAESVLITLQSHAEVFNFLEENATRATPHVTVISIAPQPLASIAASLSARSDLSSKTFTPRQVLHRIQRFCTEILGFDHVFDTTFARHLALLEHVKEFEERREKHAAGEDGQLPMLASACPGWVCYAEKAHSEMLPFISQTKSPQQVMGSLVKQWMGAKWGRKPNEIYHVTVMPCYDKKLEASRSDFFNDIYSTRDVDCVITTGELERMMQEKDWDLTKAGPGELDATDMSSKDLQASADSSSSPVTSVTSSICASSASTGSDDSSAIVHLPELLSHPGTSSGSYLHALLAYQMRVSPVQLYLSVKMIRNADYEEYALADMSGRVVFKGAKCYGFRNLQNVVRKVGREAGVRVGRGAAGKLVSGGGEARTRGGGIQARVAARKRKAAAANGGEVEAISAADKMRAGYDYVEVMACPGGCVNGGGQLKPPVAASATGLPVPDRDEEGHTRDWTQNGAVGETEEITMAEAVLQNAKWGDKEWTKKVESAYWEASPIGQQPSAAAEDDGVEADRLAATVIEELCRENEGLERKHFLRTQYHAVESEVIGLAVKW